MRNIKSASFAKGKKTNSSTTNNNNKGINNRKDNIVKNEKELSVVDRDVLVINNDNKDNDIDVVVEIQNTTSNIDSGTTFDKDTTVDKDTAVDKDIIRCRTPIEEVLPILIADTVSLITDNLIINNPHPIIATDNIKKTNQDLKIDNKIKIIVNNKRKGDIDIETEIDNHIVIKDEIKEVINNNIINKQVEITIIDDNIVLEQNINQIDNEGDINKNETISNEDTYQNIKGDTNVIDEEIIGKKLVVEEKIEKEIINNITKIKEIVSDTNNDISSIKPDHEDLIEKDSNQIKEIDRNIHDYDIDNGKVNNIYVDIPENSNLINDINNIVGSLDEKNIKSEALVKSLVVSINEISDTDLITELSEATLIKPILDELDDSIG
jgi:hypothetical protein